MKDLLFTICVALLVLTATLNTANAMNRFPKRKKAEPIPKPKLPKINADLLPSLVPFFEEQNLSSFLQKFVRMGVTETQHLIRLNDMDFRIMLMEWDISETQVLQLRKAIAELLVKATVPDEEETGLEYGERNKLQYGRIYFPRAVQSYEYFSASFGGPPPIGVREVVMGYPTHGCNISSEIDLSDKMYVVKRGDCPFLQKAQAAHGANVGVLVIINNDDQLESPSSGLGIDKNVTEASVVKLNSLSIVSLSNTTYESFMFASSHAGKNGLLAQIVPLKCLPGGKCLPIIPEEKSLQAEVSSGTVKLLSSTGEVATFEFLTSTFGSILPEGSLPVIHADPINGCEDLMSSNESDIDISMDGQSHSGVRPTVVNTPYLDAAVVTHRGACRFDSKALHAQQGGGKIVIVVDVEDHPLQRIGGFMPEAGFVGIPGVLVSAPCGEFIAQMIAQNASVTAEFTPHTTASIADDWIELAYYEWSEDDDDRLMQIEGLQQKFIQSGHQDVVDWLIRAAKKIEAKRATTVHISDEL